MQFLRDHDTGVGTVLDCQYYISLITSHYRLDVQASAWTISAYGPLKFHRAQNVVSTQKIRIP
jgi:hypothetical protein